MKKKYAAPALEFTDTSDTDALTSSQPSSSDNLEYEIKEFFEQFFSESWDNWT